jgi:hypothetical protein
MCVWWGIWFVISAILVPIAPNVRLSSPIVSVVAWDGDTLLA